MRLAGRRIPQRPFPAIPVFPNTLVIEGLAQTGGLLVCEHNDFQGEGDSGQAPQGAVFLPRTAGKHASPTGQRSSTRTRKGPQVSATSHIGDRVQAQAEIVFAHLNAPWLGTFFSPEAFLSMMRVFGAYRVGHAADGSPLVSPRRFCKSANHCRRRVRGRERNTTAMRRRVVITGIGMVTPLGTDRETVWKRLLAGESGVGYTTLFDASNFPTKISAEVRNWDVSDVGLNPRRLEVSGPPHAIHRWGRHEGHRRFRAERRPRRSYPLRRVHWQRRGAAGFDRFTEMMVAGLNGGATLDINRFARKGLEVLIQWLKWSRSRTCRPGTWRPFRRPGAEHQLLDRLRGQQPGDRRGGGDHSPRRG